MLHPVYPVYINMYNTCVQREKNKNFEIIQLKPQLLPPSCVVLNKSDFFKLWFLHQEIVGNNTLLNEIKWKN